MSNITNFPGCDEATEMQRYVAMFNEIHTNAPDINAFVSSMGTPDEWLGAAMLHVKCMLPAGRSAGTVTVSAAAVSLMMMKLEEVLYDGPKVALPIED